MTPRCGSSRPVGRHDCAVSGLPSTPPGDQLLHELHHSGAAVPAPPRNILTHWRPAHGAPRTANGPSARAPMMARKYKRSKPLEYCTTTPELRAKTRMPSRTPVAAINDPSTRDELPAAMSPVANTTRTKAPARVSATGSPAPS